MQWQTDDEEKMNALALDNDLLSCTSPACVGGCDQISPDQVLLNPLMNRAGWGWEGGVSTSSFIPSAQAGHRLGPSSAPKEEV